ncbi:MAG TPA: SDR family oxidoreductase [Candidatus Polarisedimenticolia bacterium]|nr:SDR family oxidoreductase [Candidatus Polarisedimenticolia bacterium]
MASEADRSLQSRTALICGASRGIGRACALELARLGARVIVAARDPHALQKVLSELAGKDHLPLAVDFEDTAALRLSTAGTLEKVGTIHILINNSGGPASGPTLAAQPEQFLAAFSRHLVASQILAQLLVPGMKRAGYGRILNIVSTSVRQPIRGLGVSNTIRAAMAGWSKTLATELAPDGITVNNILPGATRTDRLAEIVRARAKTSGRSEEEIEAEMIEEIPAGRFARPEEIAAAVGFLASPPAGYITGVSLAVDGGRTMAL